MVWTFQSIIYVPLFRLYLNPTKWIIMMIWLLQDACYSTMQTALSVALAVTLMWAVVENMTVVYECHLH